MCFFFKKKKGKCFLRAKEVVAAELKMRALGRMTLNSQSLCGDRSQV